MNILNTSITEINKKKDGNLSDFTIINTIQTLNTNKTYSYSVDINKYNVFNWKNHDLQYVKLGYILNSPLHKLSKTEFNKKKELYGLSKELYDSIYCCTVINSDNIHKYYKYCYINISMANENMKTLFNYNGTNKYMKIYLYDIKNIYFTNVDNMNNIQFKSYLCGLFSVKCQAKYSKHCSKLLNGFICDYNNYHKRRNEFIDMVNNSNINIVLQKDPWSSRILISGDLYNIINFITTINVLKSKSMEKLLLSYN